MENLGTVKGMFHAVANGDFPAFLNLMDPRIEWNEAENFPYADGNPYIGPCCCRWSIWPHCCRLGILDFI